MNSFMKDDRLNKELETFAKYVFEQEYKMLLNFYPNHKLVADEEKRNAHQESTESSAERQVFVDVSKMADSTYLNDLIKDDG